MNKRRSLDDTCDIFLSRRRIHSPLANQRPTGDLTHLMPTSLTENMGITPYIRIPDLPQLLDLSAPTPAPACVSTKPLPEPGSSGVQQPKPTRLANGRCHIPRPRNPFILFRCDLVHQRKVLPRSDLDDTNISRIAGDLWREMTAAEKKPWIDLAAEEKARHALLYPDYKYAPGNISSKTKKAKSDIAYIEGRPMRQVSRIGVTSPADHSRPRPERPRPYPLLRRRSSSCPPPGSVKADSVSNAYTPVLVSKDDIQRIPSPTVMYHSVTPPSDVEATTPIVPANHDPLLSTQYTVWPDFPQIPLLRLESTNQYPLPDLGPNAESYGRIDYAFLDYRPMFSPEVTDSGLTLEQLKEIECLAFDPTFMDSFSNLGTFPADNSSPYTISMAVPPLDFSGHSTGSPSSFSSGTVPSS